MASELWSNMLHEVKTPLTSIKEAVSLMLERRQGTLNPDQQLLLNITSSNLERLERMMTQLLELARSEATWPQTKRTLCDLSQIVTEVGHLIQTRCDQKGIRLMLKLPPKPVQLWASRDQLAQVILNLVDNAIKFTGRGGSITAEVEEAGADELELRVRDTGMGIPKEEQELLFDRFWRSSSTNHAGISGYGLGLAISREIVNRHGGRIWVQSVPGQGSTFFIRLPKDFRKQQQAISTTPPSS